MNVQSAMDAALGTLQPLRDLARNWDVDVASCLEEYLQELAGIHPQQLQKIAEKAAADGDSESDEVPNFAHAALILQNSSNVYSRKVEYLYSLVYKTLDEFFQASKNSSSSSNVKNGRKSKGLDVDVEEFFDFDPNECFLLLDDIVPEDLTPMLRKINLKEDLDDIDAQERRLSMGGPICAPGSASNRSHITNNNNVTRLSLGGLSVTRMERNNSSSYGGVTSQQQQRALLGILNNGSLRLVSGHCDIGDDGVLLMPGSQSSNGRHNSSGFGDSTNNLDTSLCAEYAVDGSQSDSNMDGGPRNLFENADDDDEGPGFVMNDDFDDDNFGDPSAMNGSESPVGIATLASSLSSSRKRVAFADSVEEHLEKKRQNQQKKKKKDPWQLLEPHSVGDPSRALKPLKRGKTIRLPEGIYQPPSECVTGSSTSFTAQPERRSLAPPTLRPSLAIETFRVAVGKQLEPSNTIKFRGLAYGGEFLYVAKGNAKLKAAKRREERKKEQESSSLATHRNEEQTGEKLDDYYNKEDDFGDDDNGDGFDFGGGDYDDGDYDDAVGNSSLNDLNDAFGNGSGDTEDGNKNEGWRIGKTFEEICRSHIQAFAKRAEKFALTTKLTDRISQWQAHLSPILEEEERKASFDIHRYSEMFLDSAIETRQENKRNSMEGPNERKTQKFTITSENPNIVEFKSVAEGCTQSDICRFFLASLSLANSGNLKIEEGSQEYRFQILSDKVEKPMETYRAPSAAAVGKS